jgi:hypothetical protein
VGFPGGTMKVHLSNPFTAFSGILAELVYSAFNKGVICYSREYVIPEYGEQNAKVGGNAANLRIVYESFNNGWIEDLKKYTRRYARDVQTKKQRRPGYYSLYGKMWWKVAKDNPTIDLKSVTYSDIALLEIGIKTVKEAIDEGFLPKVRKYDDLTRTYDGS